MNGESHFVHFLQHTFSSSFSLPEGNVFSEVNFCCYICKSRNPFKLGFARFVCDDSVFIVCRSPCQYDADIVNKGEHTFEPLFVNGHFREDIVRIPSPTEYERVSISKCLSICQGVRKVHGHSVKEEDSSNSISCQLQYSDVHSFRETMSYFINEEKHQSEFFEHEQVFKDFNFEWYDSYSVGFNSNSLFHRLVKFGHRVCFEYENSKFFGRVNSIESNGFIRVQFSEVIPFFEVSNGINVYIEYGQITFNRQLQSLRQFEESFNSIHAVHRSALLGQVDFLKKHNRIKGEKCKFFQPNVSSFPILNPSQVKSINNALKQRFTLIQGPPGTGKTTVIAGLVRSLIHHEKKPILVLTQTNVAADLVSLRIRETGINVLRVLASSREYYGFKGYHNVYEKDIYSFSSQKLAQDRFGDKYIESNHSKNEEERKNFRLMEREIISENEVVVTTCGTVGGFRFSGLKFHSVIFDESGQCLDPDIVSGCIHCNEQLILVGDHRQLGPVLLSKNSVKGRYDLSLMQRLIFCNFYPSVLRVQYRMHPSISVFPNQFFYKGLISDGVNESDRLFERQILPFPQKHIPTFFWNVPSEENYYDSSISYLNDYEAKCISELIDTINKNGIRDGRSIGIITPYSAQQIYLSYHLDQLCKFADSEFVHNIEISSVDSFQGREKDIIIFSCVRSNDRYDIGFLRDYKRLCVSVTRARKCLIIVGNGSTFSKNVMWCNLIENYKSRSLFVEGSLDKLVPSTFTSLCNNEKVEEEAFAETVLEEEIIY